MLNFFMAAEGSLWQLWYHDGLLESSRKDRFCQCTSFVRRLEKQPCTSLSFPGLGNICACHNNSVILSAIISLLLISYLDAENNYLSGRKDVYKEYTAEH